MQTVRWGADCRAKAAQSPAEGACGALGTAGNTPLSSPLLFACTPRTIKVEYSTGLDTFADN